MDSINFQVGTSEIMMNKILHKVFSISKDKHTQLHKPKAQSMVEFAIALPVLLLLLMGMVEFGFMLNTYLSIQDAVRSTARRYSTINPFNADGTDNLDYYAGAAQNVVDLLAPPSDPTARQIVMDSTRDNILISLIEVKVNETNNPNTVTSITRYPDGLSHFKFYNATNPTTAFSNSAIEAQLTANGAEPGNAGLLIVEIYYSYEGVINTPITTPFMSPQNPVMLYASAIMPITYVKPLRDNP